MSPKFSSCLILFYMQPLIGTSKVIVIKYLHKLKYVFHAPVLIVQFFFIVL